MPKKHPQTKRFTVELTVTMPDSWDEERVEEWLTKLCDDAGYEAPDGPSDVGLVHAEVLED